MHYHNITKDDMLNGAGLRVVLWLSGCGHNCPGCQNPITHNPNGGLLFDEAAKEEIYQELRKSYVSGITFSGGDPLHPLNVNEVHSLIDEISELYPDKNIWLYTGYLFESLKGLDFLEKIDVLIDGRFELENLDLNAHWVGSSNQRVIDVKKSLKEGEIVLFKEKYII